MSLVATAYLEAALSAVGLLERSEVAEAWERPSALAGMSVGALAVHLASEVLLVQNAWRDRDRWSDEEPVLSLLVGVATLRHGQAAVVRALSRAERAPASIAAF